MNQSTIAPLSYCRLLYWIFTFDEPPKVLIIDFVFDEPPKVLIIDFVFARGP